MNFTFGVGTGQRGGVWKITSFLILYCACVGWYEFSYEMESSQDARVLLKGSEETRVKYNVNILF